MKITGMSMTVLHPSMGDRGLKGWQKEVHTIKLTTDAEVAAAYVAAAKVLRHGSHIVAVEIHWDYPTGTEPIVPGDSWTRLYAAYESAPIQYVNNEDGDWDRHDYVQDGPSDRVLFEDGHEVINGVDTCVYTWPNGDYCGLPWQHMGPHNESKEGLE